MPAMTAAGAPAAAPAQGAGINPFWTATNLYAEKVLTYATLLANATPQYAQLNAGNFLRGFRYLVRSSGGIGTPNPDNPSNTFSSIDFENVDGAEIGYPMTGYGYLQGQRYSRPWTLDPTIAYDFAASANPSFSLFIEAEVRHTAGVLFNTDARSLYKTNFTLNTIAAGAAGSIVGAGGTLPTVTTTIYTDCWAQPDAKDLQGTENQPLPPGANLQWKRRHQAGLVLQGAGTDNIFQMSLTGNAVRLALMIVRDSLNNRQDYLTDPILWMLDNRKLSSASPDMYFQWMEAHYSPYGALLRPTGVYPFPRFFHPGDLVGQPWLYTTDASKVSWETTTLATGANLPGNVEIITDEVYPVGDVPPELTEI